MKEVFRKVAGKVSAWTGSSYAFLLAALIIVVWAMSGPLFNFSDTWQLVINTGTTIVTFLMVFLIQNTQNRDSKAMQLKLDELIRASGGARDSFVDVEDLTDEELGHLDEDFKRLHEQQLSTPAMHKLHEKIVKEHQRRLSLKGAPHAISNFIGNHLGQNNQNK